MAMADGAPVARVDRVTGETAVCIAQAGEPCVWRRTRAGAAPVAIAMQGADKGIGPNGNSPNGIAGNAGAEAPHFGLER